MPLPFTRKPIRLSSVSGRHQQALKDLMGDSSALRNLKAVDFTDEQFGVPTVTDIIKSWKNRAAIRVLSLKPRPLLTAWKP